MRIYDECSGDYYDGFEEGCKSVKGNSQEECGTSAE